MRAVSHLSIALLILFNVVCCYATDEVIPSDAKIVLKRGLCNGQCPSYTLTILSDGKVIYEGEQYVRVVGRQETIVPTEKLAELIKNIEKINFLDLAEQAKNPNCSYTTDMPSTEVLIALNGRVDSLKHGLKCYEEDFFRPFDDLAKSIDEAVDSQQWVMNKS